MAQRGSKAKQSKASHNRTRKKKIQSERENQNINMLVIRWYFPYCRYWYIAPTPQLTNNGNESINYLGIKYVYNFISKNHHTRKDKERKKQESSTSPL